MECGSHVLLQVPHGDLKSENVLVTSSLSVYITDFASSFKQVYLPLNDPSDFNFYFGTSGRRTCYIAPERFYSEDSDIAKQKAQNRAEAEAGVSASNGAGFNGGIDSGPELFKRDGKVTEAMDVFSLGCVIAELWRDGAPIFTLMQLFKYREGSFDVEPALAEIADHDIRDMVRSMISTDPRKRKKFAEYLDTGRGQPFAEIFYTFLHLYLTTLQRTSPRATAMAAAEAARSASATVVAAGTVANVTPANAAATPSTIASEAGIGSNSGKADVAYTFRAEADERIERLYEEWSVVIEMLSGARTNLDHFAITGTPATDGTFSPRYRTVTPFSDAGAGPCDVTARRGEQCEAGKLLPVKVSIPGISPILSRPSTPLNEDGPALLVLSPLLANMRNALRPSTKLHALDLLLHLSSQWLSDEAKLDRVLPYIISFFNDESILVRSAAIKSVVQLLSMVDMITFSNALTFSEYIVPNLRPLTRDTSSLVRLTYAACIVDLIEVGKRYVQMASAMRAQDAFQATIDVEAAEGYQVEEFFESGAAPNNAKYDWQMAALRAFFREQATTLLTDPSPAVKRTLLDNIGPLCTFFGTGPTNDVLLSHMITYLNDRSWLLRQTFFDAITYVATVAGPRSVEDYILPLMLQTLSDPEEFVVVRVLEGLHRLLDSSSTQNALLSKVKIYDIVAAVAGFLCHPNYWLRSMSALVISTASTQLSTTDVWALVYPSIRPLLRCDVHSLQASNLLFAVHSPLSREVVQKAIQWAFRAKSSGFWKASVAETKGKAGLSNGLGVEGIGLLAGRRGKGVTRTPIQRSEEDDGYLDSLRSSGLNEGDEVKLVALRDYIARLARMSSLMTPSSARGASGYTTLSVNQEDASLLPPLQIKSGLAVQPLDNVTPLTIFFGTRSTKQKGRYAAAGNAFESGSVTAPGGSVRSQAADSTFSGRMARRRLGGSRTVSDIAYMSPLEELRRRMMETTINDESGLSVPQVPITALIDGNEHRPSSPVSVSSVVGATHHSGQAKLGLGKALPAIAAISTTATGTMSELSARLGSMDRPPAAGTDVSGRNTPAESIAQTFRGATERNRNRGQQEELGDITTFTSTYEGHDPYIQAHLEAIYLANFRDKHPALGPTVTHTAIAGSKRRGGRSISSRANTSGSSNRRPEGNLIAYFTEHTASITAIAVSPDSAFFLSGSEDGTIKVWDTARLEKNVTSRSRATYTGQRGKITALSMLEASHCAASAASDGSVHVIRVETNGAQATPSSLPKYGKIRLVSNFQLSHPNEYVVCLAQSSSKSGSSTRKAATMQGSDGSSTSSNSTLILATSSNRIVILDLRTMQVLTNFDIASHYGSISTLCLDTDNIWLLVATIGGVMCLWDLRFHLLLKTWRIGDENDRGLLQVNSCILHPSRGKGKWVMVAYERLNVKFEGETKGKAGKAETLLETWDIDKAICVERFEAVYVESAAAVSSRDANGSRNNSPERGGILGESPPSAAQFAEIEPTKMPNGLESAAQGIERLVKTLEWNQDRQQGGNEEWQQDGKQDETPETEEETTAQHRGGTNSQSSTTSTIPSVNVKVLLAGLEGYTSSAPAQSAQVGGGWLDAGKLAQEDARTLTNNQSGPAGYLITAGQDRRIRFWDLGRVEKSCCLAPKEERGDFKSVIATSKTAGNKRDGLPHHFIHQLPLMSAFSSLPSTKMPTRSPLILHQQTNQVNLAMKAHKDTITTLGIIESPFRCIIAGDQAGTIRVWE